MPRTHAQSLCPEPSCNHVFPAMHIKGLRCGVKKRTRTERWNCAPKTRTDLGYHGLIRAEMQTYRMQADNIKRWGSIARPPPERLGMSGWERLSAEGRSKRLKIWSPGLPISNPTSCNHYLPAPRKSQSKMPAARPFARKAEPVPTRETNPKMTASPRP